MSTILYALLCIGLFAAKYYFEQKSKDTESAASDGTIDEEPLTTPPFYEYELTDDSEEDISTSLQEQPILNNPLRQEEAKSEEKVVATSEIENDIDSTYNKDNITLSTREEARRAFIYSEIFNRKYEWFDYIEST